MCNQIVKNVELLLQLLKKTKQLKVPRSTSEAKQSNNKDKKVELALAVLVLKSVWIGLDCVNVWKITLKNIVNVFDFTT